MSNYIDPVLSADDANDEVTRLLIAQGYSVRKARLNPRPYSQVIGCLVDNFKGARITYRVENQGRWVRMIYYELNSQPGSLRNSFSGFQEFLDFLATEKTGIQRLYGAIHEMRSDFGRELPTERISAFYKRILCGKTLEWRDGQEIIYTEMTWWLKFRKLDEPQLLAA